jgi:hypothetical protein
MMMSSLNTMEMVKVMNTEVQIERSQFREPTARRGGWLASVARRLLGYASRERAGERLEPATI